MLMPRPAPQFVYVPGALAAVIPDAHSSAGLTQRVLVPSLYVKA
jgi:hypothetical protein